MRDWFNIFIRVLATVFLVLITIITLIGIAVFILWIIDYGFQISISFGISAIIFVIILISIFISLFEYWFK